MSDIDSMFTTIVDHVVRTEVEAYSIHTVVRDIRTRLLDHAPRGHKTYVEFTTVTRKGERFLVAQVNLVNARMRTVDRALVISEEPMVATKQYHANDHKRHIACSNCKGELFFHVDRSTFYENHICAGCGREAHTLTETGAST